MCVTLARRGLKTRTQRLRGLCLALLVGLLAACNAPKPATPPGDEPPAGPGGPPVSSPTGPAGVKTPLPAPRTPSVSAPGGPYARIIERARMDLAQRLKLETGTITLVSVIPDEFPAGDLGCPDPKHTPRPIPALVSGQVIVLEAQGQRYTYHARRNQLVFCGP